MELRQLIRKYRFSVVVQNGQEMLKGSGKPSKSETEKIKAMKPEIIAEIKKMIVEEEEKKAAEEAAKSQELEDLKAGKIKISVSFHDGEYLSGYQVFGQAADLLKNIGVAKYVDGWGCLVEEKMIGLLGKEFCYGEAVEYAQPSLDEKAEKKKIAKEKIDKIFQTAKETGEKQVLRSGITNECTENLDDCSFDSYTQFALPNGKTETIFSHCH